MPVWGSIDELLKGEQPPPGARKPRADGLDKKVAHKMLTQLGLRPDAHDGAIRVAQNDRPELFATLVSLGYNPVPVAGGGLSVRVPPAPRSAAQTAEEQRFRAQRLVEGREAADRPEKVEARPAPRPPKPARAVPALSSAYPETEDWERAERDSLERLQRARYGPEPDFIDEEPGPGAERRLSKAQEGGRGAPRAAEEEARASR